MRPWRILDSGAARGSWNLALDEAVFHLARRGASPPTLRFYAWSPAAISVGYFQRWERQIDQAACRERGLDVLRRITGGRAVLHRHEVTYSVVCAESTAHFGAGPQSAYRGIARALAQGLRILGVEASLVSPQRKEAGRRSLRGPSCFSSSGGYEIDAGGRKLVGSAQKREGGDLLQHGSMLVAAHGEEFQGLLTPASLLSAPAPGMTSLQEQLGRRPPYREVVRALAEGFRRALGVTLEQGEPSAEELGLAEELEERKYLSSAWNGSSGKGKCREPIPFAFLRVRP